jgi:hypothetical protein
MKSQRFLGILFLIGAGVLLFVATDASDAFAERVQDLLAGHFTQRATLLFAGGIAAALLGAFLVLATARPRHV